MSELRVKLAGRGCLAGTFVKTPAIEVVEVLAQSGLDFLCLDSEHAPFDRARLDTCLAIGRALGVQMLVRVAEAAPREILQALDAGAHGIVVPHVDSAEVARAVARAARFGHGGRGYAGSTRFAGFGSQTMPQVLALGAEPLVIVQIEAPEAVEACEEIAAVEGIDGLFLGPADLSVAHGRSDQAGPELAAARARVGAAAQAAGKTAMTFVADPAQAEPLLADGYRVFFVASEHAWMRAGAAAAARGVHALGG